MAPAEVALGIGYKIRQVQALFAALQPRLLIVSEKATYTRMFTFRTHMESLLLWVLLPGYHRPAGEISI